MTTGTLFAYRTHKVAVLATRFQMACFSKYQSKKKDHRMEARNYTRIINVSNRLPIKICKSGEGYTYEESEGGLATALKSVFKDYSYRWLGWPGAAVPTDGQPEVTEELESRNLSPVFLSQEEVELYYEGFSNGTLWPLFHYFPSYCKYDLRYWECYEKVNRKFCDAILEIASPEDTIWIHDYQLMLLPSMLREHLPHAKIGYFQHIPFPAYEIYKALPWKKELTQGLLGADVIGFQTTDDADYFLHAAAEIGLCSADNRTAFVGNRNIQVEAFPISIDYDKFAALAEDPRTLIYEAKITERFDTKIALSVDRLDYSKGILQRLRAYECFLEQHPEWQGKITLLHVIVPSRDTVSSYSELKQEINKLISEINGKFARLDWQPIHHFYHALPTNLLAALYKKADLALVTPLRDGMNLVSKEYIASNSSECGALILGEAAGAARELKEAYIVNPHDLHAFSETIFTALNTPEEERKKRMRMLREKVRRANVFNWMQRYFEVLSDAGSQRSSAKIIDENLELAITERYINSRERLILLDYDGTLVDFQEDPMKASPDEQLLELLSELKQNSSTSLAIISGRDRATLEKWFGNMPLDLVSEHGAFFKKEGKWYSTVSITGHWKTNVKELLRNAVKRLPGSFIEEKTTSLVLHYRNCTLPGMEGLINDIGEELKRHIQDTALQLMHGNKIVEVKYSNVDKGKATLKLLQEAHYDFVLAAGDDTTDEDIFGVLGKDAITIKVGKGISAARYRITTNQGLRNLLKQLATVAVKKDLGLLLAS